MEWIHKLFFTFINIVRSGIWPWLNRQHTLDDSKVQQRQNTANCSNMIAPHHNPACQCWSCQQTQVTLSFHLPSLLPSQSVLWLVFLRVCKVCSLPCSSSCSVNNDAAKTSAVIQLTTYGSRSADDSNHRRLGGNPRNNSSHKISCVSKASVSIRGDRQVLCESVAQGSWRGTALSKSPSLPSLHYCRLMSLKLCLSQGSLLW